MWSKIAELPIAFRTGCDGQSGLSPGQGTHELSGLGDKLWVTLFAVFVRSVPLFFCPANGSLLCVVQSKVGGVLFCYLPPFVGPPLVCHCIRHSLR